LGAAADVSDELEKDYEGRQQKQYRPKQPELKNS
jgi:hypothetical protein